MRLLKWILILLVLAALGAATAAGGVLYAFYYYGKSLPDHKALAEYEPPVTTRVHAGDGRLLAEFATEKRIFVPIGAIPKPVIYAFLSAEDKAFYEHPGVDLMSIAGAMVTNLKNIGQGRRLIGASTITQQVAKNFLLTNEVSWVRKIKEAILALRIEKAFDKDRILELYLNEIYLGYSSYGAAAAALNYFNKSMDELTIGEAAFLAALPKAPNNYHPIRKREAAIDRRNWVISRLLEDARITPDQAAAAKLEPLNVRERAGTEFVQADYFAEEVRKELAQRFGEEALYQGGLSVRATVDPKLQAIADKALRDGLIDYDRRHGYRGPVTTIELGAGWQERLASVEPPKGTGDWLLGVIGAVADKQADIHFADGGRGIIDLDDVKWAREPLDDQKVGDSIKKVGDVLQPGNVVLTEPVEPEKGDKKSDVTRYTLNQIPKVEGALVAIDPHTGRVLALSGGYSFEKSQFDRAIQAKRQPGSAFKPFVYLAGLENGLSPNTIILDAPFVIDQGPGLPKWRPGNYSDRFYGPSTMRLGIEKSRNLMTVRLAQKIGMEHVAEVARRFGIIPDLQEVLAMSLGAGETTLMNLTTAYAMLVNGGKRIEPTLIDRIQNRNGVTVFRHDARPCPGCNAEDWRNQPVPQVPDTRDSVGDPAAIYQIVSMLEGVVQRGTGRRIASIGKPLAGKTGTTNNSQDAWFVGFSPDLAVGAFVGFDEPKGLGNKETGSSVAAPVFKSFMEGALAGQPGIPFRVPPGIRLVRVNASTGLPARAGDSDVILEAFRPGNEPNERNVIDGNTDEGNWTDGPAAEVPTLTGTGGLY